MKDQKIKDLISYLALLRFADSLFANLQNFLFFILPGNLNLKNYFSLDFKTDFNFNLDHILKIKQLQD